MKENTVENALRKSVAASHGKCLKLGGVVGINDDLVLLPGGVVRLIECKRPNGKPRKIQSQLHRELRALGLDVRVVDNVADAWRAGSR